MKFDMGEKVFVKVTPYCHLMRLEWKGKLMRRFMGPFKILEHVSQVTY